MYCGEERLSIRRECTVGVRFSSYFGQYEAHEYDGDAGDEVGAGQQKYGSQRRDPSSSSSLSRRRHRLASRGGCRSRSRYRSVRLSRLVDSWCGTNGPANQIIWIINNITDNFYITTRLSMGSRSIDWPYRNVSNLWSHDLNNQTQSSSCGCQH